MSGLLNKKTIAVSLTTTIKFTDPQEDDMVCNLCKTALYKILQN